MIVPTSTRSDKSEFSAPPLSLHTQRIMLRNVKLESIVILLIKQKVENYSPTKFILF